MNKKVTFDKKYVIAIVIFLIIALSFSPYIKADFLTLRFGDEFSNLYTQTAEIADIEYLRVLDLDDENAKICYISKDHKSSEIATFKKSNDEWILSDCSTLWSKTESKKGFMWPYYA